MLDPAPRDRAPDDAPGASRSTRARVGSQPAIICSGVWPSGLRSAVSAMRSEPGPSGGRPRCRRKTAPAARSASAAGLPSAASTPAKDSPAEWATMNQGGTPARAEGADHRARRGADDELRAAGSQSVSSARACRPPVSQAPPSTPPAPSTRPTLMTDPRDPWEAAYPPLEGQKRTPSACQPKRAGGAAGAKRGNPAPTRRRALRRARRPPTRAPPRGPAGRAGRGRRSRGRLPRRPRSTRRVASRCTRPITRRGTTAGSGTG